MKKTQKVTETKMPTATDILNVEGIFLPTETAEIAAAYHTAFLRKGFTKDEAFELTAIIMRFYFK